MGKGTSQGWGLRWLEFLLVAARWLLVAGIELQLNGYWPDVEFHQLSAKDFPMHQIPSSIAYSN